MQPTDQLPPQQRDELLRIYRKDPDPELRFRAPIILLLAGGHPWSTVEAMLFCRRRTSNRWRERIEQEGIEGLAGRKRGRPLRFGLGWVALIVTWVTQHPPGEFGFLRSRWACATVALLLHEKYDLIVSRETVRRCWLRQTNHPKSRKLGSLFASSPLKKQELFV